MAEQKWRMICEKIGLDYDDVIADPEPENTSACSRSGEPQNEAGDTRKESRRCCEDGEGRKRMEALADYAEKQLAADIRAGINMEPMELWELLEAIRELRGSGK